MKLRVFTIFFTALLAMPAYAGESPAADTAAISTSSSGQADSEPAWDASLAKGMELLQAKQPEAAIREAFDPVIAGFEEKYASEKRRIYCARTMAETLLYMAGAASNKQDAIALQPTWAYAWFMKAYAFNELGRIDDAHSALLKALELSPNNPQFLSELGYGYMVEHKWQDMLDTYTKAEAMVDIASPDDLKTEELTRALRGQGYALTEMGKYDEAEARYKKALQADPNDEKSKGELEYITEKRNQAATQP